MASKAVRIMDELALPLQISGFILLLIGTIISNMITVRIGLDVHFIGDAFFFFLMKRRGCL